MSANGRNDKERLKKLKEILKMYVMSIHVEQGTKIEDLLLLMENTEKVLKEALDLKNYIDLETLPSSIRNCLMEVEESLE